MCSASVRIRLVISRSFDVLFESPVKGISTILRWEDDFSGDLSKWYQDDFTKDDLHRTGYKHLGRDGGINEQLDGQRVPGRWAALMNKYRDKVQFIRDGKLVMKGHAVKENNPYRVNFNDSDGKFQPYGDYRLYSPWLSTWTRKWSENRKRQVTDWENTTLMFGPGSVIEARVNFENQTMGGFRWSLWIMAATDPEDYHDDPATVIAGTEYDADVSSAEIDCPEVENPERYNKDFGHYALMKIVGGEAGDTPDALQDIRKHGIDLRKGWHTFTTVWNHDGSLVFYCDNKFINQDPRSVTMQGYLIMSCEMNSGIKQANGPKRPRDPGLTEYSVLDDIDLIDKHEVLVDYVRVFDIVPAKTETLQEQIDKLTVRMEALEKSVIRKLNPIKRP